MLSPSGCKCHHEALSVLNSVWSITITMQKHHSLFIAHANIPIASLIAFALWSSLELVLGGWGELAWCMWESPFSFQLQVCLCGRRNLQIYKSITLVGKGHARLGTKSLKLTLKCLLRSVTSILVSSYDRRSPWWKKLKEKIAWRQRQAWLTPIFW